MQALYNEHQTFLNNHETLFERDLLREIDWEERLIFIKGARGVGKSTLILQHVLDTFEYNRKALYITMDSLQVADKSLFDIATFHYNNGGTHLFVDEIHKYENWSQELKNINDLYKKFHVVISGSSILHINKGKVDLSRRAVSYTLQGLSLREYINIETKNNYKKYSLQEVLENHVAIAQKITKEIKPLVFFKNYINTGYYPYYLEGLRSYPQKLNNTLNLTMEIDLPYMFSVDVDKIFKIKKLLYILAGQVPFQPNSTKLAAHLGINRGTLNTYMNYLHEASVLHLLWDTGKSYSLLSKPEKLYLNNPNIFYLYNQDTVNVGSVRESFFINQVSYLHDVFTSKTGDFLVENKYTFEVGGNSKNFNQIAGIQDSFLAVDEMPIGEGSRIPLWLFGFLY